MFKRVFVNSFINRVILYDDKVIILYNSNDRETKRLNKKQLKEVENAKNLEEIKENSSERKKFKRVALGGNESRDVELYAFNKEAKYLLVSPLFL